ncbi:MAG: M23 family metallopeptidase [Betaproteobacteria bacterium]|nr:M23 family metallopeptidase [Betaproteobacteria bacterium]MCL2886385.1 M23 family metallopeptidase [Betaproteobacteria bacterium]
MQIILVSRHFRTARTIAIMPRHVLLAAAGFVALVLSTSLLLSWLSVHWRLPLVENLVMDVYLKESQRIDDHVSNNLRLLANRLGELQGKLMQLDSLGGRVASLTDSKPAPAAAPAPALATLPNVLAPRAGQGGPFMPVPLNATELQQEIERLAAAVDNRAADLEALEFQLLEERVRNRLLPTTLPVKAAYFGSSFGVRTDPIVGEQARHEGIDFVAPAGTPIVAAADGVVLTAGFHPEFGNMIDIDHSGGLTSRYAHLSRINVAPGALVKHGERIGAVGSTGRSTGPHLHFEVRMLGVAQNPALFLKQNSEFARFARR